MSDLRGVCHRCLLREHSRCDGDMGRPCYCGYCKHYADEHGPFAAIPDGGVPSSILVAAGGTEPEVDE